jgi:hypothetical protein
MYIDLGAEQLIAARATAKIARSDQEFYWNFDDFRVPQRSQAISRLPFALEEEKGAESNSPAIWRVPLKGLSHFFLARFY